MRTAQNTPATTRCKERQGRIPLAAALALGLATALGGCRHPCLGRASEPVAGAPALDASPAELLSRGDASLRRIAVRRLRDGARREDLRRLEGVLDDPDTDVAADAALALAVCGVPGAPGRLVAALSPDARPEVVDAAVLGLGTRPGDDARAALLRLAERPERPAGVPGALFSQQRWNGLPPVPHTAAAQILPYARHADAEGRAGFGHYARTVKDPALVPDLLTLLEDPEPEVRRAAAAGLASGREELAWSAPVADRVLPRLLDAARDDDVRVAVAVVRAIATFDREDAVAALTEALSHPSFHVRMSAVQGLTARKATAATEAIARLARKDPSVSVRGASASAIAKLDPAHEADLATVLLADPAEFVRASACDLLAAVEGEGRDAATARLVDLAFADPHVRVRGSAMVALDGRTDDATVAALRRALADDPDAVVVAYACSAAVATDRDDLRALVRAVPGRFPGREGADARQGALEALATWGRQEDADVLRAHLADPNPSVAFAAESGLAQLGGFEPPSPRRAGVGGALPGDLAAVAGPVSLVVETTRGTLTFALDHGAAPRHVEHVVALADRGFYDGLTWHRVVPDFVIQGGCPRGDGSGSAGVTLPLEPTRTPYARGVLGMPRSSHPDSGGCQLFVMHSRAPHLDGMYTAFGRLTDGDDVIDAIDVDDTILSVRAVRGRR